MKLNHFLQFFVSVCSLLVLIGCFVGLRRLLYEEEENKCAMTYMFSYPQFIKIHLEEEDVSLYQNYNLYIYGEEDLAEKYNKGKFKGLPILFIPGNAGSYKQVRSIASIAYRKGLDSRKHFHLDFFSIDFNEEWSALFGGVLDQQVSFTIECIKKILSLYKNSNHSVLLIGHSMGGMIAKAIFSDENFDSSKVNTIITLATPHQYPIIAMDENIANFYQKVNQSWFSSNKTANVTLASIGGADRDILVRSGLTAANQPSINVLTTGISGVWLSVDHLCIVWCKQLQKVLVRSLFDLVDHSTLQWKALKEQRHEILSYHLVKRYGGKSIERNIPNSHLVNFDPEGKWREIIAPRYTTKAIGKHSNSNTYFMIPLIDNANRERLVAVASNLQIKNWVFACVANAWRNSVRFCESGIDLSSDSLLLPSIGDNIKRKLIYLNLGELREGGFTHVIFSIPRNQHHASVEYDLHSSHSRLIEVQLPLHSYMVFTSTDPVVTPLDALSYNITLPQITKPWQSIAVSVTPLNCTWQGNELIRKVVPWSSEDQYYLTNHTFSIHLHQPKKDLNVAYEPIHLQLLNLNQQCSYVVKFSIDWIDAAAQFFRFYIPFIFPLVSAIFLHAVAQQMSALEAGRPVPSTVFCVMKTPVIWVGVGLEIAITGLNFMEIPFDLFFLPLLDDSILRREGLSFPLLYSLLGFVAWIFAIILTFLFWMVIAFGGHALHSFIFRYVRSFFGFSSVLAELLAMGLTRVPIILSIILIGIAVMTCGSLTLLLGLIFCFWKLFAYYEDELESMLSGEEHQSLNDGFRFNMTVSILWLCSVLSSLPTLIVWSKTQNFALPDDPTLVHGCIMSIFGMIIVGREKHSIKNQHASTVLSLIAVSVAVYGLVSFYRVQFFITVAIVIIALENLK